MKITCYIIDDEPLAIDVLQSHLEKMDRITIEGTFQNAVEAFEALHEKPVDLLFLDIQMPALTGVKFLRTLTNPPQVIFTTAYREYAVEGFELNVTDYLLKPISFERLLKAIDKVLAKEFFSGSQLNSQNPEKKVYPLYVQVGRKRIKIRLEKILFIESQRDYVKIKTINKEITVRETISNMEENLPDDNFLRTHRSFIVNLKQIESWSSVEIELSGSTIPIGRTYKRAAMKVLKNSSDLL